MTALTQIKGKLQIKPNTVDTGRMEKNLLDGKNWDVNEGSTSPGTITGIPDPINDLDVVNKRTLATAVNNLTATAGVIGPAEDGTYTDGLFTDFQSSTTTGTAVDRFNEVLKALAPQPAPNLTTISSSTAGVSGKLTFGPTNTISGYTNVPSSDINDLFSVSGDKRGIFNASATITATLASNVTPNYVNSRPYPNNTFGAGNEGTLHLEVNDVVIHSVNLTSFGSGNSLNAQNSGFNLSAAVSVKFDNGNSLDLFKYRSGTLTVAAASMRNGYNKVRVRHEVTTGVFRDTNVIEWVIDADVNATNVSGMTLDSLVMSGNKQISGVKYHTNGSANIAGIINNVYRNTYVPSNTVTFNGTNCSSSAVNAGNATNENNQIVISSHAVVVNNASRLLNNSISLSMTIDRTVQSDLTTGVQSIPSLLLDATTDNATDTFEPFNGEGYRMASNVDITSLSGYATGMNHSPAVWDSTQHLISGGLGHSDGLLISNGELTYPKNTSHIPNITNGDFTAAVNGPASNVNYSSASGTRTFLRYFYTSTPRSNFRFAITSTNTSFVSVATGVSGNNLTFEILAPNTTKNGANVEWKDAVVAYSGNDNGVGAYASTFGNTIPSNWGCTIGSKNTSTSGNVIVVRVTASAGWTGKISDITITWL